MVNTICGQRDILNLLDKYPASIKLNDDDLIKGENERLKIDYQKQNLFV